MNNTPVADADKINELLARYGVVFGREMTKEEDALLKEVLGKNMEES